MTWPWPDSLIGSSEFLGVGLPQPRPLDDGSGRGVGRSALAKPLEHGHGHLGQYLAKILEGGDSVRRHCATPRNAVELAAKQFVQLPAKILLLRGHSLVSAVPGDKHADPGLLDLIQAAEQIEVRVRLGHPRVNETQARRRQLPVAAYPRTTARERGYRRLAVEALRGEVRGVVCDGLGVVRLIWAPGIRCLAVIFAGATGRERRDVVCQHRD